MASFHLKLFGAFSLLFLATVGADDSSSDPSIMEERKDLMCRAGKYGLEKMENRRLQNNFCMEHASRTCCDVNDALKAYQTTEAIRRSSDTSRECMAVMQDALCSHCDPDIVSTPPKAS